MDMTASNVESSEVLVGFVFGIDKDKIYENRSVNRYNNVFIE